LGSRYEAEVATLLSRAGLSDTTLVDASGLSPANQSTPRDLAQFYAYMRATYPTLIGITELRAYITDTHEYVNTNPGRDVSGYRGGKNGFTDEAQRTFLGEFAVGGGETIGMVLLKSETLSRDIETLFAYAEAVIKSGILHAHDTR
jgi:D-alanyl-D-alanine carboxypeptidase